VNEDDTKRTSGVRRSLLLAPRSAVGWWKAGAGENTEGKWRCFHPHRPSANLTPARWAGVPAAQNFPSRYLFLRP